MNHGITKQHFLRLHNKLGVCVQDNNNQPKVVYVSVCMCVSFSTPYSLSQMHPQFPTEKQTSISKVKIELIKQVHSDCTLSLDRPILDVCPPLFPSYISNPSIFKWHFFYFFLLQTWHHQLTLLVLYLLFQIFSLILSVLLS